MWENWNYYIHFPVCKREGCENVLYMYGHKLIFTLFPVSHNPSRKKTRHFYCYYLTKNEIASNSVLVHNLPVIWILYLFSIAWILNMFLLSSIAAMKKILGWLLSEKYDVCLLTRNSSSCTICPKIFLKQYIFMFYKTKFSQELLIYLILSGEYPMLTKNKMHLYKNADPILQ